MSGNLPSASVVIDTLRVKFISFVEKVKLWYFVCQLHTCKCTLCYVIIAYFCRHIIPYSSSGSKAKGGNYEET